MWSDRIPQIILSLLWTSLAFVSIGGVLLFLDRYHAERYNESALVVSKSYSPEQLLLVPVPMGTVTTFQQHIIPPSWSVRVRTADNPNAVTCAVSKAEYDYIDAYQATNVQARLVKGRISAIRYCVGLTIGVSP